MTNNKFILKHWFFSRILILLIALITIKFFSFAPTYPYWQSDLKPYAPRIIYSWAAFDGAHYIKIAKLGYEAGFTQVFFPAFPLLIKLASFLKNPLLSGLLISNISFLIFLFYLNKLVTGDFSAKLAKTTVKLYLYFPTTFFFNSLYTESFFMVLTILFFYLLKRKSYFLACFFAALASATRIIGVFLSLVYLTEYLKKNIKFKFYQFFYPVYSLSGFLIYLLFLKINYNDPWLFFKSLSLWDKSNLTAFPLVFVRYFNILTDFSIGLEKYYIALFEFVISIIFLSLLVLSYKKIKLSYFIFCLSSIFLPLCTGTLSSFPRYVLVAFPLFVVLAEIIAQKRTLKLVYWIMSILLLIINVFLFTRGKFVA